MSEKKNTKMPQFSYSRLQFHFVFMITYTNRIKLICERFGICKSRLATATGRTRSQNPYPTINEFRPNRIPGLVDKRRSSKQAPLQIPPGSSASTLYTDSFYPRLKHVRPMTDQYQTTWHIYANKIPVKSGSLFFGDTVDNFFLIYPIQ